MRKRSKPDWCSIPSGVGKRVAIQVPAIIPGNLDQSLLINAVRYNENVVSGMPPKSKLPAKQIEILEAWVKMGAPDPRPKATPHNESSIKAFDLDQRFAGSLELAPNHPIRSAHGKRHSLARLRDRSIHLVEDRTGETCGLRLPRTNEPWLRRVYFDLIGLPPSRWQTDRFLEDDSADSYEQVVTELLQSPHFGEKWARHWMDLVRYADTYGHEFDYRNQRRIRIPRLPNPCTQRRRAVQPVHS